MQIGRRKALEDLFESGRLWIPSQKMHDKSTATKIRSINSVPKLVAPEWHRF
jgi:hypothetical protein